MVTNWKQRIKARSEPPAEVAQSAAKALPSPTFSRLLARVEGAGIVVRRGLYGLGQDDPAGDYQPPEGRIPAVIHIYHVGGANQVNEPEDTFTLAHEYGHERSYRNGERTAEYEQAIKVPWKEWPQLPTETRALILEEEQRAWMYARQVLGELGFSEWEAFERHRDKSLATYRARLYLS
jgi:hypothetical protein